MTDAKKPDIPEVINIVGIPVGWAFLAFIAGAILVAGAVYLIGTHESANDSTTE